MFFFDMVIPTRVGQMRVSPFGVDVAARFIPTCVGQMVTIPNWGKHQSRFIPTCVGQMRPLAAGRVPLTRFIPTCVGQMLKAVNGFSAHDGSSPRAWGRFSLIFFPFVLFSVHPHVRGADDLFLGAGRVEERFIPTCVGQMSPAALAVLAMSGSSPRAWGR